jgi:hypothetical protein
MGKRVYFYKDKDGTIKKYAYCNNCPGGPYTEDQEYNSETKKGSFIKAGKHLELCIVCAKLLGIDMKYEPEDEAEPLPKSPKSEKIKTMKAEENIEKILEESCKE